jgi:hypothetical protein
MMVNIFIDIVSIESVEGLSKRKICGNKLVSEYRQKVCGTKYSIKVDNRRKRGSILEDVRLDCPHTCVFVN